MLREGGLGKTQEMFKAGKPFCMLLQWWINDNIHLFIKSHLTV